MIHGDKVLALTQIMCDFGQVALPPWPQFLKCKIKTLIQVGCKLLPPLKCHNSVKFLRARIILFPNSAQAELGKTVMHSLNIVLLSVSSSDCLVFLMIGIYT